MSAQILACRLGSEKQLGSSASAQEGGKKETALYVTVVMGNLYRIEKKKVPIGRVNKLRANVSIADTPSLKSNNPEETKSTTLKGASSSDYHVAGL